MCLDHDTGHDTAQVVTEGVGLTLANMASSFMRSDLGTRSTHVTHRLLVL